MHLSCSCRSGRSGQYWCEVSAETPLFSLLVEVRVDTRTDMSNIHVCLASCRSSTGVDDEVMIVGSREAVWFELNELSAVFDSWERISRKYVVDRHA